MPPLDAPYADASDATPCGAVPRYTLDVAAFAYGASAAFAR